MQMCKSNTDVEQVSQSYMLKKKHPKFKGNWIFQHSEHWNRNYVKLTLLMRLGESNINQSFVVDAYYFLSEFHRLGSKIVFFSILEKFCFSHNS